MSDCTEIKINLNIQAPHFIFLKENKREIDENFLQNLDEIKKKYKQAPWRGLFDLPEARSHKRLVEFAESRRCLFFALKELSHYDGSLGHTIHLSLSHTTTYSAAVAVLDKQDEFVGVGIDIELKDRKIKPEIKAKFTFESEEIFNLSALELWTIKEASFKAKSKFEEGSVFQYEIKEYDSNKSEGTTAKVEDPSCSIIFKMCSYKKLLITVALARRRDAAEE